MRSLFLGIVAACGIAGAAAPQPVRNPFWPVGYEGERTVISPAPRVKKAPPPPPVQEGAKGGAAPVAQEAPKPPTGEPTAAEWKAVLSKVKVGVVMRARDKGRSERTSVIFNGKVCNVGEEVQVATRRRVFVWRFDGCDTNGVVRLTRQRSYPVRTGATESAVESLFDHINVESLFDQIKK